MSQIGRFLSKLLSFGKTIKKKQPSFFWPSIVLLEDRVLPSTLIQIANVDGYVADANQDGVFDTVNTTGAFVQTSQIGATGSSTDQSCSAAAYYNYNTSYSGNLPIGQEFKPSQSSLSFVDLVIADAGSDTGPGANFYVRIHSGTMAGAVLGTSATVFVPDNTNISGTSNYTHFTFASPISLSPGSTYVIEAVQAGSIVGGNSNFMITADNPNGADVYTAGRGVIHGTPVTTHLDFLFREGTGGQPGVTERGVMEFSTAGVSSTSTVNAVTLYGTIGTLQNGTPAALGASFYAYAGDGQITTADATVSGTLIGSVSSPVLGPFSVNLSPSVVQSLIQSPSYAGYLGILVKLTNGQRFFLNSMESTAVGPVPTLQIVYDTSNHPPVAANDLFKLNGSQLTVSAPGVLGNDSDPDGDPLTAFLVTGPTYGSLSLAADGSFVYTPYAGTSATDTFTYEASDGSAYSNIAKITIQPNHAPVAYNYYASTLVNVPLNLQAPGILANDYDPDYDPMSALLVTGPSHGTLTLNSNGSFYYVPNQDYTGPDSFTYQASDGYLTSNVATVNLVVDTLPVAQDDTYSVNQGDTLTVNAPGVLGNDSDVNGDRLLAYRVAGPAHGSLSLSSNGFFTYTPTASFDGADSFTYKVSDGYSFSNTATVTITVNHVNHAPTASNDSYSANQDTTLSIQAPGVRNNDSDPDGDPITAILVTGPAHGSVSLNADGSFSYTPNAGYVGADSFTYKDSDGALTGNTATVAITVNHVNHAPVAVDDAYSTNEDQTLTIAPVSGVTSLVMQSPAGEYIGQGRNYNYTSSTGAFTASRNFDNGFSLSYTDSADASQWWYVDFAAPGNADLTPGNYLNATRYPFQSSSAPGLDIAGEGRGSNTLTGQFTVVQAIYGTGTQITRFDATFLQHSDGQTQALTGEIKYNYSTAPSGVLQNDSDPDGDPLTAILVTGPAHGTVTLNADGSFTYKPNANYNGTDSFTYKANDGSLNSNVAAVNLTVNPVNDAPSFTKGASQTNVEGDGAQTVQGWATNISAGPADEAGQSLNFVVSTTNDALFAVAPAIDSATGTLTYTLADGAVGGATVSVQLHDNGGTANGGSDISPTQTFKITINDAVPTLTLSGAGSADEGSTYTLGLSAIDPDVISKWTITWGDGAMQTVSGNPSSVTHVFADGPNSYTISATATDEDGTWDAGNTVAVTVNNVVPTLTLSGASSANESSFYTLGLTSSDPGQDTIASWKITWGDGSNQTVNGNPSSVTHVYVPGSYTITATATDEDGTYNAGNSIDVTVNAVHLVLAGSSTPTAGSAFDLTVSAVDPSGNSATGYFGTVHFTSSDGSATLPADYMFNAGDAGSHNFAGGATLDTAGTQTITATDTQISYIVGSMSATVSPAATSRFAVVGPSGAVAGTAITVAITAYDAFGNVATGYTGTLHFTSSDGQAALPADYAFVAGDAGVHSFNVTLKTAGAQSLTATDTAYGSHTGSQTGITVTPAAAANLTASGFASPTAAGVAHAVTVTLRDAFGNVATGYTGTVRFTSSDPQASLPANYSFTAADAGMRTFSVILKTAGTQSITVTDAANSALSGAQSRISVTAAAAASLSVTGVPNSTTAGVTQTFSLTARDAFGNIASSYTGTVHFTSTDAQAGLPANYTFVPADGGVHSFLATLKTAGTRSITATDVAASTITGSETGIAVNAAAATHFAISASANVVSQASFTVVVTALDAYGNVASGYRGKIQFSSSDHKASLPADYTFTSGDAGVHTFTVSLKTRGVQSISVKDAAANSITGAASIKVQ